MRPVLLGLMISLSALLGACGGDSDPSVARAGDDAAVTPAHIERAAQGMVDTHGELEAFIAVFAAFDRGYALPQILSAAVDGGVAVDGTLSDAGGQTVDPAGPPLDLFGEPPDGQAHRTEIVLAIGDGGGALLAQESPVDQYVSDLDAWAGEVFEAGKKRVDELTEQEQQMHFFQVMVLSLAARGYSPEQILDGLFFGTFDAAFFSLEEPVLACPYLSDQDGTIVPDRPSLLDESLCDPLGNGRARVEDESEAGGAAETETPTSESASGARDGGTRSFQAVYRFDEFGDVFEVRWTGSFVVDDGAVSGTVDGTGIARGDCEFGDDTGTVDLSGSWTGALTGSAEGGSVTLRVAPNDDLELDGHEDREACLGIATGIITFAATSGFEVTLPDQPGASETVSIPIPDEDDELGPITVTLD